jgi:hypothetical protein
MGVTTGCATYGVSSLTGASIGVTTGNVTTGKLGSLATGDAKLGSGANANMGVTRLKRLLFDPVGRDWSPSRLFFFVLGALICESQPSLIKIEWKRTHKNRVKEIGLEVIL